MKLQQLRIKKPLVFLEAAQAIVHGPAWVALEKTKEALATAKKALADNKDDAKKADLEKAVTDATEAQKVADESYRLQKLAPKKH